MFLLDTISPIAYRDPWQLSFSDRMTMLLHGKIRIAYFYERADNSTFRYRVYNMVRVINDFSDDISASYFFLDDLCHLNLIADKADMLVVCRSRYSVRLGQLFSAFKTRGKKILFDVDDLVFNTDSTLLLMRTLNVDLESEPLINQWVAYLSRMGMALRESDGAIATNRFLADQVAAFADIPTAVVPNYMNKEQLALSDRVFDVKKSQHPGQNGQMTLGYFSGTPTHANDFAMIIPALENIMHANPHVNLAIAGYIEANHLMQCFGDRVMYYPFTDYVNLQSLVGSVEFNLVPLQYNVFTNCKSELKYFEAAAVGTPTIASPIFSYAHAIRHGDNGYLAMTHQWEDVILEAISNLSIYPAMATRAREDALSHYAWYNQRPTILAALGLCS